MDLEKKLVPLVGGTVEPPYPPKDEPNEAIIMSLDGDANYTVLAHRGRFFHGQCVIAGFYGEEVGVSAAPDVGIWVFENAHAWASKDWETGIVDDYGIDGDFRKPRPEDFERFEIECPIDLTKQTSTK